MDRKLEWPLCRWAAPFAAATRPKSPWRAPTRSRYLMQKTVPASENGQPPHRWRLSGSDSRSPVAQAAQQVERRGRLVRPHQSRRHIRPGRTPRQPPPVRSNRAQARLLSGQGRSLLAQSAHSSSEVSWAGSSGKIASGNGDRSAKDGNCSRSASRRGPEGLIE